MERVRSVIWLLAWAPLFFGACGGKLGSSGSNAVPGGEEEPGRSVSTVVLVSVEAVRPDLLSLYGGEVSFPSLDRLAASGIVFEDAATSCPMARPAVATLTTGVAPDRLAVRDNVADRLPPTVRTLAERFQAAGFTTAAFVSSPFSSRSAGFDRGFGLFDGPEELVVGPAHHFPPVRSAAETARHFVEWLSTVPSSERVFAWVHFADLHGLANEGTLEEARAKYRETAGKLDAEVAKLLDALEGSGRSTSSEIVFVGTHGVQLGEGGARGDSFWLTRETLRVPLVWSGGRALSGRPAGARLREPVSLSDVAVTLAAIAEPGHPIEGDGRDLFVHASGGVGPPIRRAWSWATDDQFAWPTLTAVEENGQWRVFDWRAIEKIRKEGGREPAETAAAERPAVPRNTSLSTEARARLERLGVALGVAPSSLAMPPAEANSLLEEIQKLRLYLARGRPGEAQRLSSELVKKYPENLAVLQHRLFILTQAGRKQLASSFAKRLLELYPDRPEVLHWAGHAELIQNETGRAEALFEAALESGREEADVLYDLACSRALANDRDRALDLLRRAVSAGYRNWAWIESDPDLANVRSDPRFSELLRAHGR